MNSVFVRSSLGREVPREYSAGLVVGPVSCKASCGFKHTLDELLCRPRKPSRTVESLATLALAVYIADKSHKRSAAADAWTRDFLLSVPIEEDFVGAVPLLRGGLEFLSGDVWQVETRIERAPIGARTYYDDGFVADAVCLFSGGNDSLTGAINLLESGLSVALVSHFESGSDARIQRRLAAQLCRRYGSDSVRHRSIQVCSAISAESSTRARSFLFIALGLMIASVYGDDVPVYMPENGFVGINAPLTGSRQGSYSTRTTHPTYLASIRAGLQAASIRHAIINPFSCRSKGETLRSCKNQELLRNLLPLTVSCAKANWVRWKGRPPGTNCGFCYPCLIRRAAMHVIGIDNPNAYLYDAIGSPEVLQRTTLGRDLRSLLAAVSRYRKSTHSLYVNILKSGSLSSVEKPSELVHPVETGLSEVVALVSDKGCSEVKQHAFS